jgi:diacylglycerol kinase (ATP)
MNTARASLLSLIDTARFQLQHAHRMDELFSVSRELPAIVFVNPSAGSGRAQEYLARIKNAFATRQLYAEFIFTSSLEELESRTRLAIAAGRRVLLALGGDGTLQGLVNAACGSDVVLGILPAGGGNDFAAALGLPKNPLAAAEAILGGQPRAVDILRARTADGRERLYVGGGGVGLDAEAALYAGSYRGVPGRWRYVTAALRALIEFTPLRVRAEFPGSETLEIERKVLVAAVLNTPTYGAGIRLAPTAQIDDGLLTTILVEDFTALEVLRLLPRLVTRGTLPESHLQRVSAKRVRLTPSRPCRFHGDGEILGPAPVEIEVLPRAIRVLAPRLP